MNLGNFLSSSLTKISSSSVHILAERKVKYIDIIIGLNTTQFYAQYVQYIPQLHVSAHFRPSSGCFL